MSKTRNIYIEGPTGGLCFGSSSLLDEIEGSKEITKDEYLAIMNGTDTEDEGTNETYLTEYDRGEEDNVAGIDIVADSLEDAKEKAIALGEQIDETVIVVGVKDDEATENQE